jgi:hypothetical protein
MENTDKKLDQLLNSLSQTKPELKDAGLLTDSIMNEIRKKTLRTTPPLLIWIRMISSSAAIFLLGLFLFQQNEVQTVAYNNKSTAIIENKMNIDSLCMANINTKQTNLLETYYCYMQQNSIKNKQLQTRIQQLTN